MTVGFFCLYFPNRNAQNLRRIKQRKGLRFIQAISADKDDEMIFSYADFCIGLLAIPNNREFTRRNRVSGHFCGNFF